MSTTVVALKLTPAELDVLDWLASQNTLGNRSAALREAMLNSAMHAGVQFSALADANEERKAPRRAARYRKAKTASKPPATRSAKR